MILSKKQQQKQTINWLLWLFSLFSIIIMLTIKSTNAQNSMKTGNAETFYKLEKLKHYLTRRHQRNLKDHEIPVMPNILFNHVTEYHSGRRNVKRMRRRRSTNTKIGGATFKTPTLIKFDLSDAIEPNEEMKKLLRKHYSSEISNTKGINGKNKTNIEKTLKTEGKTKHSDNLKSQPIVKESKNREISDSRRKASLKRVRRSTIETNNTPLDCVVKATLPEFRYEEELQNSGKPRAHASCTENQSNIENYVKIDVNVENIDKISQKAIRKRAIDTKQNMQNEQELVLIQANYGQSPCTTQSKGTKLIAVYEVTPSHDIINLNKNNNLHGQTFYRSNVQSPIIRNNDEGHEALCNNKMDKIVKVPQNIEQLINIGATNFKNDVQLPPYIPTLSSVNDNAANQNINSRSFKSLGVYQKLSEEGQQLLNFDNTRETVDDVEYNKKPKNKKNYLDNEDLNKAYSNLFVKDFDIKSLNDFIRLKEFNEDFQRTHKNNYNTNHPLCNYGDKGLFPKVQSYNNLSPNYNIDTMKFKGKAHGDFLHNEIPFHRSDKVAARASRYSFGYRIKDFQTGNDFGHKQNSDEFGIIHGQYHILLPDGRVQNVFYKADHNGFHADVTYESGDYQKNY